MASLKWTLTSLKQRGIRQTFAVGFSYAEDYLFDWCYGTDTIRRVEPSSLQFSAENKRHASIYGATKARPFLKLMELLSLPKDATFVDIGSGKGRVLMLAPRAGFKKVVGIEFSPELCAIARRNLELYQAKTGLACNVEIVESDASQYSYTPDQTVFYMFNPFDGILVEKVVRKIGASIQASPRPCWLIYLAPQYKSIISATGVFPEERSVQISGSDYQVYSCSPKP
ncbi:MAG: methyltransferase domain-containing protein [Verrucomicrobia bacterium]|nr:methyltransferase domain-containing protein [Verrucomicrobiota bacterium]MBI3870797.1 methyltransferase domain-containing protein [Verrucomicrobiota bacterium]